MCFDVSAVDINIEFHIGPFFSGLTLLIVDVVFWEMYMVKSATQLFSAISNMQDEVNTHAHMATTDFPKHVIGLHKSQCTVLNFTFVCLNPYIKCL